MTGLAIAAGLAAGIAVLVLTHQLRPAPPRLDVILRRIQTSRLEPSTHHRPHITDTVGQWLAERLDRPAGALSIPRRDLAIIGKPAEVFMLEKLTWLLGGAAIPPLLAGLLTWAGFTPTWALPAAAGLTLAACLSFVPDLSARSAAARHRRDFRYAFCCYLQLIVLEREAGAALAAALEEPAKIADNWAFRRIHQALERTRRTGRQPWQALADLGEQIGVAELQDLAYTAMIAGGEGAKIHTIITAKIASMRNAAAATTRSDANTRTTTMWVPVSLLMLGFVVLVAFPFFYRLLNPA